MTVVVADRVSGPSYHGHCKYKAQSILDLSLPYHIMMSQNIIFLLYSQISTGLRYQHTNNIIFYGQLHYRRQLINIYSEFQCNLIITVQASSGHVVFMLKIQVGGTFDIKTKCRQFVQ